MRYLLSLSLLFHLSVLFAGISPSIVEPNAYQSSENKHYWKNRLPNSSYWQQDVHYKIDATIDDSEESITASETLIYTNNSPDTLYEVYFHLYQNAFTPNSYAHELRRQGKIQTTFGEHESKGIGTKINHFAIDHEMVSYTIDNTILHAKLSKPLLPGERIEIYIDFISYWDKDDGGNMRRRMKSFDHDGYTHFDGVHWYPRICVYDRKFGWTTDQHLGKEFYGDFGMFEVSLNFPNQYIVEATGELINEREVLPKELREAIDLKNYKTSRSEITQVVKANGSRKTWRYYALNVHDFAFTADPTYRMSEVYVGGVKCVALAQEQNAHLWQPTAEFVSKVIATYSNDFGEYIYPKMVAADARDGMEYPMLTLNGGNWPGHQYVIAHEVGHNWFFGMLGNNETYRSALDEGFTQFLTAWSLKKINNQDYYGNPLDKQVVFERYLSHAAGDNNATLNVHADHYNSAERHGGGYGQVYFKTASMLYNLQYVLGDELFSMAMKHYVGQWKTCHPYWEDFKQSIIQYTKVDLNWFFDEWITTTHTIDYAVKLVKHNQNNSTVTISRKGNLAMPLDVRVVYSDGSSEDHYIPNTYFVKKTDAIIERTWIGWDQIYPEYSFETRKDLKVKDVIIDPSERLADINKLNNSKRFPVKISYSNYKSIQGNFDNYEIKWNPTVWYNAIDGLKAGIELQSNYANYKHVVQTALFYNSGLLAQNEQAFSLLSYRLNYRTELGNDLSLNFDSRFMDGLTFNKLQFNRSWKNLDLNLAFKSMYRNGTGNLEYLLYPEQWNASMWNNVLDFSIHKPFHYMSGNGELNISTRASALYSDYGYGAVTAEWKNTQKIKKLSLRSRWFAQLMSGDIAPESKLMLAGANNEELMEEPFLRSRGFVPSDWEGYSNDFGHIHYGGGLNLRAYSGYKATNMNGADTFYIFSGNTGTALNLELDFNQLLNPFKAKYAQNLKLNTYVFSDAGVLWADKENSSLRFDAGVGTALTIRSAKYNLLKPVVLRLDLPLFVNRIPAGETDYVKLRYLIGISRAF